MILQLLIIYLAVGFLLADKVLKKEGAEGWWELIFFVLAMGLLWLPVYAFWEFILALIWVFQHLPSVPERYRPKKAPPKIETRGEP